MKFDSKPIEEHQETPLADDGRWEALVSQWTDRQNRQQPKDDVNHCYVMCVGLWKEGATRDAQLGEILGLVRAQGDEISGHETYRLKRPDPRTFIGRGIADEVAERATDCGADMLVIDAELTPSQTRNLEEAVGISVCDREAVILNVFSRHAKTRKARIQVEIAHLEYLRPRIRGVGLVMDQQAGGVMRGRGPGETASELLARQLDSRLVELRKAFAKLQRAGDVQRQGRRRCERIVLVGYTNAGKTTLMNALTEAGLSAKDKPFETLDTTSRCLTRHGGDVLLSDTVGFIRRLPERLFASFESTLAEAREASLLALTVDAADPEWRFHLDTTEELLTRLGADAIPRFYVFNKMDRVQGSPYEAELAERARGHHYMALCGHDGESVAGLRSALIRSVRRNRRTAKLFVPYEASDVMAAVYAKCRVLASEASERGLHLTLEGEAHVIERLEGKTEEVQL